MSNRKEVPPRRTVPVLAILSLLVSTALLAASPRPAGTARVTTGPKPVQTTGGDIPATVSFSDPDGQALVLEDLSVRAAVHGMLSLTEMEFRFRNPLNKRMEGRFQMVLPAGAAISRFAKEVNGKLMEGEVVERLRANRIYDEILHQMRDPALLEQEQGNRFSARIFPIEPRAEVRLVLSYSLLVPGEDGRRTYRFPLRGLPRMGHFHFTALLAPLKGETLNETRETQIQASKSARLASVQTLELEERDFVPDADIEFSWKADPTRAKLEILQAGEFALYAFRPELPRQAVPNGGRSWHFFVDTSASGAEGARFRARALETVLRTLPSGDRVEITFFDQTVVPAGVKPAAEWAREIGSALTGRAYLGATDLAGALTAAASAAARIPAVTFVLVSDGAATLGPNKLADLVRPLDGWPKGTLLHALVMGPRQDRTTLENVTRGRGRIAEIPFTENLEKKAVEATRQLRLPLGAELSVNDPAAEWFYPRTVADVQPGQEILCFARLRAGEAPHPALKIGKTPAPVAPLHQMSLPPDFSPLLEREAYRAYLAHLSARLATEADRALQKALETEKVRVSIENRILIPETTLLVLETEEDYRRFGLDRRALSSILTIGLRGIARLDRTQPAFVTNETGVSQPKPVTDAPSARDARDRSDTRANGERGPAGAKKEKGRNGGAPGGVAGGTGAGADRDALGTVASSEALGEPAPVLAEAPAVAADHTSRDEAKAGTRQPAPAAPPPPPRPAERERTQSSMPAPTAGRVTTEPQARQVTGGEDQRRSAQPPWTVLVRMEDEAVRSLEAQIKANPLNREPYSQLAEGLAGRAEWKKLRELSLSWLEADPENPQPYETLGDSLMALGRKEDAARAYGSLVEVAAAKPELVQRAGLLLFRCGQSRLGEKVLRAALEMRPDRLNAHRHLALVLWRAGKLEEAARVLETALRTDFPGWSASSRRRVLSEELGYVLRSWRSRAPEKRLEIEARAREAGVSLERTDRVRITLAWETDANDVDLHVADPNGAECFYGRKSVPSGLELYEDVTRGFGPEVIRAAAPRSGTYTVGVKYFSSGPMGASRGIVVVLLERESGAEPELQIIPFRLVSGGGPIRRITSVDVKGKKPVPITE